MKKQFLLFGLLIILFSACKKESFNATSQAAIDDHRIQLYIAANHLNVTKDPQGFYYEILRTDTGAKPNDTSTVQVSYTGKLLNGGVFDTESASLLPLAGTVVGFREGIPLVNTGGRILLIIPSGLGYGSSDIPAGNGVEIPPNSVLVFTIDLLGFY